jgi:hypothetical protein
MNTDSDSYMIAMDLASIIKDDGTYRSGLKVDVIRDIASFTLNALDGQKFTIAVSPVCK